MYTIRAIKKFITKAREAGACEEEINSISRLKTAKEVYAHQSAPYWACWYAREVLKARWIEAEDVIKKDPGWTYYYAIGVLKARWIEAEDVIKTSPEWIYYYAKNVLQSRWIEAEDVIKTSPIWYGLYKYYFDLKEV